VVIQVQTVAGPRRRPPAAGTAAGGPGWREVSLVHPSPTRVSLFKLKFKFGVAAARRPGRHRGCKCPAVQAAAAAA
jgi:hypothetical protein